MKSGANLIETIQDRCHECYACVRNCPAKALRVSEGQAEVIGERCIHCGNCVRVCSQGAKKVRDSLSAVKDLLDSETKVVAGVAPSFPSYDSDMSLKLWMNYLYSIGFDRVYEVAWGAELVIKQYKELLKQNEGLIISSACPVVVNIIQKYYPDLLNNLAGVVSPMQALDRYIKSVEEPGTKVVMIGPCLAKKGEFEEIKDSFVLTFSEALSIAVSKLESAGETDFLADSKITTTDTGIDSTANSEVASTVNRTSATFKSGKEPADSARKLPLAGGLIKAVTRQSDYYPDGFIKVEGSDKVFDLLNSIKNNEIKPRFVDVLFCEGCINGVDLSHENYFKKENAVYEFVNNNHCGTSGQVLYNENRAENINFSVEFTPDSRQLPQPDEKEIWEILNQTNKYTEEDLLNCGACGYESCREKAIAVCQGLAEVEMCLPYLLSEKRTETQKLQELNRELDTLINSSYDGMLLVNKDGKVERVNQAYLDLLGLSREYIIDININELEKKRFVYPSVSHLCIKEKREITIIQNTGSGQRLLTTGSPILDEEENVIRIVVNTRNLTKLNQLDTTVEEKKLLQYLDEEVQIDIEDGPGHIISKSSVMKNIIKLAQKVGNTDSSVLIMGESGVGKEVIARYIHEQSNNRQNLIKINCAAIPESLLESELFGYETGAFSGAKREGKPGLIEKADGGTLFLDEIAEMPMNMQAKLLQVLQEHRVIRIGGVESIDVNFRLITATNKNLKDMVEKKQFREDLYYRLNVVPISIPPLKERRADILALFSYYLELLNEKYNKDISFTESSVELLKSYDWPGNVRELTNLLERVVVTADEEEINQQFLRKFIEFEKEEKKGDIMVNNLMPLNEAVSQVEKKLLMLAREEGRTTYQMAEMLGVNQSTIVRKMKKYFK
ncbi:MAG: sigma 54-interacting transcriptional regulator [Halothermotrichaceae bacterium]